MMKQEKKLVKKITSSKKRNSINAVDGWNEFLKDLKKLEVEHQQRDLEFKLSIDPAKRNAAIDKLIRVVKNKVSDLFSEVVNEFSEDEINLIEERIEIPDSISTYNRGILIKHISDSLQLIIIDEKFKAQILSKVKINKGGTGRKASQDKIINYIEVIRIFHDLKKKKSKRFLSNAINNFNNRKDIIKINPPTLYKFLRKINFKMSILYTPEFFKDKTNDQIFSYLEDKFNFNAKV